VNRLTIAALVDLTPQAEGRQVISAADAEEIIKRAVGFRSGRDEVRLTNARLTGAGPAEPDETLLQLQKVQAYVSLARNVSLAAAVFLALLVFALLALRRRVRVAPIPAPAPAAPAAPAAEERRAAELNRFLEMARRDPDRVAEVFRTMVGEPTR
jgi:flagellar M-ring protein FliF